VVGEGLRENRAKWSRGGGGRGGARGWEGGDRKGGGGGEGRGEEGVEASPGGGRVR